ncbi:MAG TPA: hypothetical protein VH415_15625 [Nitrososphaeraceae archaeon]
MKRELVNFKSERQGAATKLLASLATSDYPLTNLSAFLVNKACMIFADNWRHLSILQCPY